MSRSAEGMSWLAFLFLMAAPLPAQQEKRVPVPEAAEQKKAEALIHDIFKEDYGKKSIADRILLSKKLLEQGMQTQDDPISRYVLLLEAKDLATQAGDISSSLRAVSELARLYEVDAIAQKLAVLTACAKNLLAPEAIHSVARAFLEVGEEAVGMDRYEAATEAIQAAATNARKAKDLSLLKKSEAKAKEVAERKGKHDTFVKALEILKSSPDDPASNLAAGRYECWLKGDWESGLPHLAKGADPLLQDQAKRDLLSPTSALERAAVGDGWWDLAEKEATATGKLNLRARALYWFEQTTGLTGLTQARVEKRLLDLRMDRFGGAWLDVSDPQLFGISGKAGEAIELKATPTSEKYAHMDKLPPGDYDGVSFRMRFVPGATANGCLDYEKDAKAIFINQKGSLLIWSHKEGKDWINDTKLNIDRKDSYVITLLIKEGEYRFYLDGIEKLRRPTDKQRLLALTLEADYAPVVYDQIRLRRRD